MKDRFWKIEKEHKKDILLNKIFTNKLKQMKETLINEARQSKSGIYGIVVAVLIFAILIMQIRIDRQTIKVQDAIQTFNWETNIVIQDLNSIIAEELLDKDE